MGVQVGVGVRVGVGVSVGVGVLVGVGVWVAVGVGVYVFVGRGVSVGRGVVIVGDTARQATRSTVATTTQIEHTRRPWSTCARSVHPLMIETIAFSSLTLREAGHRVPQSAAQRCTPTHAVSGPML